MALLSAFNIIRTISLFHLMLAYFFLVSPRTLSDQNMVFLLGESMRLPHISISVPTPATAFLAVILAFLGLADLTSFSLPDVVAFQYWIAQVPVRVAFLFGLTGYVYVFKPGGLNVSRENVGYSYRKGAGPGDQLKNSFVFTWAFLETVVWFWVFVKLREQRKLLRVQKEERAEMAM